MPPLLSVKEAGTLFTKCKVTVFSPITLIRSEKNRFLFIFLDYFLCLGYLCCPKFTSVVDFVARDGGFGHALCAFLSLMSVIREG